MNKKSLVAEVQKLEKMVAMMSSDVCSLIEIMRSLSFDVTHVIIVEDSG